MDVGLEQPASGIVLAELPHLSDRSVIVGEDLLVRSVDQAVDFAPDVDHSIL